MPSASGTRLSRIPISTLRMTSAGSPATSIGEVRMTRPYDRAPTVNLTRSPPAAPTTALPVAVVQPAPGLAVAHGAPGSSLSIYQLASIVIDSGVRWSRRWLERQLRGGHITAHVLTHAQFDHAGSSACCAAPSTCRSGAAPGAA